MACNTDFVADASVKTVNRQRSANQIIVKAKSSPAGIDWRLIRTMRETVRRRKDG